MKYAPDEEGNFNGQTGYSYISFEKSVGAVTVLKGGREDDAGRSGPERSTDPKEHDCNDSHSGCWKAKP